MPDSQKTESTAQVATGSAEDSQVIPCLPAQPIITETQLGKAPAPTLVGGGKTAKFTFTETAEEPSVHVTAEQAARLADNSLLTCLKKQHRTTTAEREALLIYFTETVRRFARPRLRDANGKFVSDGRPTLQEAFAAIGLSFEAEQKRAERYRKQLKELAQLNAAALPEGAKESKRFLLGEEVYFPGVESSGVFYVVGKDEKSNTYALLSGDGKEEKQKMSPEILALVERPAAHKLKEDDRYKDAKTGREFVYDGNGGLKPVVLPEPVRQALDAIGKRQLDASRANAQKDVSTEEEKAAEKSLRHREAEARDKKKVADNEADRGKTKQKAVRAATSSTRARLVKTARIGDTEEFGVFPETASQYTTDQALTIGTRDVCEAERDRINKKCLAEQGDAGNLSAAAAMVAATTSTTRTLAAVPLG